MDRHGDRLPPGAIARLGTTRWRHGSYVSAVAFAPDGKTLASVGGDRALRLSEVTSGKTLLRVALSGEDRPFVAFAPDGRAVAVANAVAAGVCLFDADTGREQGRLIDGVSPLESVRFAADGKTLVVADETHHVNLWDLMTQKVGRHFQGIQGPVRAAILSPDGSTLAVGDGGAVRLWDVATGRLRHKLRRHQGNVTTLAFSPDGRTVATGGDRDSVIRLWDVATGRELIRFSHPPTVQHDADRHGIHWHDVGATSAVFAPDGKTVFSSGRCDRYLRCWDAVTGQELRRYTGAPTGNTPLALSADGKVLAAGSEDGSVRLWDTATGCSVGPADEPRHRVVKLAFSGDGQRLTAVNRDGIARVWDLANRQVCRRVGDDATDDLLIRVAVSADGRWLANGRVDDETITVWDLETGEIHRRLEREQVGVLSLALSGDGTRLLTQNVGNTAALWDVAGGRLQRMLGASRPLRNRNPVALSDDGKRALLLEKPHGAGVWDPATGNLVRVLAFLEPDDGTVFRVAFSADGRLVAALADSNVVSIWDVGSGRLLLRLAEQGLRTPEGILIWESAAFSRDGRLFATSGPDAIIQVWELESGKEVRRFPATGAWVGALAFAPDGRRLAGGYLDSSILIWDLTGLSPDGRLPPRMLTDADRERLWQELADADAARAERARWQLVADGAATVSFLRQRLRPAGPVDTGRLGRLIRDLDDDRFDVREQAAQALEACGPEAAAQLQRVLSGNPSPEVRRQVERVLAKWQTQTLSSERLRERRALAVLEQVGTPESWELITGLTRGVAEAYLTQEAKRALERR